MRETFLDCTLEPPPIPEYPEPVEYVEIEECLASPEPYVSEPCFICTALLVVEGRTITYVCEQLLALETLQTRCRCGRPVGQHSVLHPHRFLARRECAEFIARERT